MLAEQHDRQKVGSLPTRETACAIVELSRANADGLTTYGDIWKHFRPKTPWHVFTSRREVTNALERVQHYCVRHALPLLVTLVVNGSERGLTEDAKANIVGWARENGVVVGPDRDGFIDEQRRLSRKVAIGTFD